jgi:hypothetical protein
MVRGNIEHEGDAWIFQITLPKSTGDIADDREVDRSPLLNPSSG